MSKLNINHESDHLPQRSCCIQHTPPKCTRNSLKSIILHLLQKHLMMFRQTLVITPDLPNETVFPHATRALGIVFSQTPR